MKTTIFTTIIALFLLQNLAAQPANNLYKIQLQETDSNYIDLKILSWNIYMLPARTFIRTAQKKRARLIADTLSQTNYDVILFSEAFHPVARKILAKRLRKAYPYQTKIANKSKGIKTNSGLWIISQLPIDQTKEIIFKDCAGADCWARKGAMLATIQKNNQTIQLIVTHLQAYDGEKRDSIRCRQYKDIYQRLILPNTQDNVPQIITGDMNTTPQTTYQQMLQTLQANDIPISQTPTYTWTTEDYGNYQYLFDYVLIKPNGTQITQQNTQRTQFTQPWKWKKQQRKDLSDHYGMELQLQFVNGKYLRP